MSGHGHGKAILLGEHAVVEGAPALVSALSRGVLARVGARTEVLELKVPEWDLRVRAGEEDLTGQALTALIAALLDAGLPADAIAFELEVEAKIPARAGVGSSAAIAVAVTRALSEQAEFSDLCGEDSADRIEAVVAASEGIFHGRASGVDAAIATRGGVGVFLPGTGFHGIVPGEVSTLVVAHTGPKPPTREAVEHVRDRCRGSSEARRSLQRLGDLAEAGEGLLVSGELQALGEAMNEAHHRLAGFDLSTPAIDDAVKRSLAAGALGAKLTGAGGGGCIVALCPVGEEQPVMNALTERCPWVGDFPCEENR